MWNLGAFTGGLAGLAVSAWVVRWGGAGGGIERSERKPLLLALSAYIVLILITVMILLIPPIKNWLGGVAVQTQFPETVTALGRTWEEKLDNDGSKITIKTYRRGVSEIRGDPDEMKEAITNILKR